MKEIPWVTIVISQSSHKDHPTILLRDSLQVKEKQTFRDPKMQHSDFQLHLYVIMRYASVEVKITIPTGVTDIWKSSKLFRAEVERRCSTSNLSFGCIYLEPFVQLILPFFNEAAVKKHQPEDRETNTSHRYFWFWFLRCHSRWFNTDRGWDAPAGTGTGGFCVWDDRQKTAFLHP